MRVSTDVSYGRSPSYQANRPSVLCGSKGEERRSWYWACGGHVPMVLPWNKHCPRSPIRIPQSLPFILRIHVPCIPPRPARHLIGIIRTNDQRKGPTTPPNWGQNWTNKTAARHSLGQEQINAKQSRIPSHKHCQQPCTKAPIEIRTTTKTTSWPRLVSRPKTHLCFVASETYKYPSASPFLVATEACLRPEHRKSSKTARKRLIEKKLKLLKFGPD